MAATNEPARSHPTSLVYVVTDLDRSVDFYRALLGFDVVLSEPEAILMENPEGSHLVLRALAQAVKVSAHVGIQFSTWGLDSADELTRAESWLVEHDAFVSRSVHGGIDIVEGRDPDRIPLLLHHPSLDASSAPDALLRRIYNY
jgi:catechol 2,3-dioxygenase-like lactoylglutathione lyase family enzyme